MPSNMLSNEWKRLKSGTDIRGVALPEGGRTVDLTDETVERIAAAFARWLSDKAGKPAAELTVSVGRDSRLSGPRIREAVIRALTARGVRAMDCGLASTPAMFMTTVDGGCDGAIQITASHHPFDRNGLKFFTPAGGLDGGDIEALLLFAQEGDGLPAAEGRAEAFPYMDRYAARLRDMIARGLGEREEDRPLSGFRIVVDAGNGAGGFYAAQVLEPLGADIGGSQFLEPDGRFPNHIPNPENEEAMASVCAATVKAGADMGIIFDTDVDRAGCVDAAGREINRNRLIALAAAIVLEENPGGTIVTDSITSSGLHRFIEELGGVHCRFRRGYKNVINEALRLNAAGVNAPLAIETSGHAALRENYFLDDGAYLATKLLIRAARMRREGGRLEHLIDRLAEPAESVEVRFPIAEADFRAYGQRVLEDLTALCGEREDWRLAPDSREGVRISLNRGGGEGWFLLRLSVHDPVMPLNIESDAPGGCRLIAQELAPFLHGYDGLDCGAFDSYLAQAR